MSIRALTCDVDSVIRNVLWASNQDVPATSDRDVYRMSDGMGTSPSFTALSDVETTLWIWPFLEKSGFKPRVKDAMICLSFKWKLFKIKYTKFNVFFLFFLYSWLNVYIIVTISTNHDFILIFPQLLKS